MTPLAPHITAFLRERLPVDRRASEHTCDTYAHAFRLLFQFAATRLSRTPSQLYLEQIDATMVLAFLQYIETERKNGPVTRNGRLAAIKSFMRYIEYQVPSALDQVRRILAIPFKKTDTKLVAYLTLEEMQAILNVPAPHTRFGIRDRAMLDVCFVAGLRVSELVGLKVEDVTFEPQPSVRILGKGRRTNIACLEADRRQSSGVVGDPWPGCSTRTFPKCTWRRNDPDRIRIRAQATCWMRETESPFTTQETRFAAHIEARMCHVDAPDNTRHSEGCSVART